MKCGECDEVFLQVSQLKTHQRLNAQLKRHQKLNVGGNSFKCDICNKCFSLCRGLKEHKRILHTEW